MRQVEADQSQLQDQGLPVTGVGVDEKQDWVVVFVSSFNSSTMNELKARYPGAVIHAELTSTTANNLDDRSLAKPKS